MTIATMGLNVYLNAATQTCAHIFRLAIKSAMSTLIAWAQIVVRKDRALIQFFVKATKYKATIAILFKNVYQKIVRKTCVVRPDP